MSNSDNQKAFEPELKQEDLRGVWAQAMHDILGDSHALFNDSKVLLRTHLEPATREFVKDAHGPEAVGQDVKLNVAEASEFLLKEIAKKDPDLAKELKDSGFEEKVMEISKERVMDGLIKDLGEINLSPNIRPENVADVVSQPGLPNNGTNGERGLV